MCAWKIRHQLLSCRAGTVSAAWTVVCQKKCPHVLAAGARSRDALNSLVRGVSPVAYALSAARMLYTCIYTQTRTHAHTHMCVCVRVGSAQSLVSNASALLLTVLGRLDWIACDSLLTDPFWHDDDCLQYTHTHTHIHTHPDRPSLSCP